MKNLMYIGLAGVALLGVSSLLVAKSAMAIEKAKYTVVEKEDDFEIRQYDPQIVAETFVEGDLEEVGNEGFRRLYAYISGENTRKQSISMTAPVSQESGSEKIAMTAPVKQEKKDNQWRITFLMPSEYTLETIPEPNDARVVLTQEPGRLMAAVKYSGTWSEEGYEENKALLEEYIQKRGLTAAGEPVWARYDPPFMPWFLRRNEVLIPIEKF
ncbi:heme-binding protein [bacterium]|nr:heme-binding protein [bacterium]